VFSKGILGGRGLPGFRVSHYTPGWGLVIAGHLGFRVSCNIHFPCSHLLFAFTVFFYLSLILVFYFLLLLSFALLLLLLYLYSFTLNANLLFIFV